MKLIIVRHAESTGNAQARWQGHDDTHLTDLGRQQAARLRERFESEGFQPSHIYSSPLTRTSHTARIASGAWELPIVHWDDLVETNVGIFTGKTWEDIESELPEIAREFAETRNLDIVEGAETHSQRSERAQRVIDKVIADHGNDDSVLLFSHGGTITHIFAQLIGTNRTWGLSVKNTAIFDFTIDVDRWHLDGHNLSNINLWRINRFNDADHLE